MKQILAVLARYLPPELAFEGSGAVLVAAFLLIGGAFGYFLWKAVVDAVKDEWKEWLREDSRGLRILVFCVPLLAAATLGRPVTVSIMVFVGVLVAFLHWRKTVRFRILGLFIVTVLIFAGSLTFENALTARRRLQEAQRFTVYVVLPFQPFHADDQPRRLRLSQSLLRTIGGIFGPVANVKVEPAAFNQTDLDDWTELNRVAKRLQERGVSPDVMLVNLGAVVEDPDHKPPLQYLNLLLKPSFVSADADQPTFNSSTTIVTTGRIDDVEYLAIRASLDVLAEFKKRSRKPLSPRAEGEIVHNALNEHLTRLQADGACSATLCPRIQAALRNPALTLEEARELVKVYPPDERKRLEEIQEGRQAATIGKVGPAGDKS